VKGGFMEREHGLNIFQNLTHRTEERTKGKDKAKQGTLFHPQCTFSANLKCKYNNIWTDRLIVS
jgi:hypothetical protein